MAQPPSGGCVLKPKYSVNSSNVEIAATFGWLCVETLQEYLNLWAQEAATFGWLCVETFVYIDNQTSL